MFIYLLENNLLFNSGENLLSRLDTGEMVTLPHLSARILQQLIQLQGQVLTREAIFREIFDPYHAVSTNNNLNQYMLGLRKQLNYLGMEDEIIKTVPKIGFIIPEYIRIEQQAGSGSPEPGEIQISSTSTVKKPWHWFSICWLALLLLLLSLSGLYYFQGVKDAFSLAGTPSTLLEKIPTLSECTAYMLPGSRHVDLPKNFSTIEENVHLPCHPGTDSRFYYSVQQTPYKKRRQFMMRCENSTQTPSCYSFYNSDEGEHDAR